MMFKERIGCELKCRHLYFCYADKYIGAYNPYTNEVVGYKTRDKFCEFVQEMLLMFPDYSPHCVINDGISELIKKEALMDIAKRELLAQNLYKSKHEK
jgi:hypothetical protein